MGLALGAGNTGLTLEMQLKDTAGSNVGSAVTSGFVEFGSSGSYLFHYASWPTGHRGAAVFQISPGGTVKAAVAINPEEAENTDIKSSTLATAAALATVQSDTDDIQTRLPAALVSGRIDASVGAMAANTLTATAIAADAITAAKIAADAIGASELAADAVTEIQTGLATAAALAIVQADTDDIQTRLPAVLVSGRIDSSVGAMAANTLTATAIATDAITAAKIAADAIGASELAADAVTEIQSGLATATALATVQADTDDIQTRLPTALVAGRIAADAIAISGSTSAADAVEANIANLDAAVSTRSSHTAADVWAAGTRTLTSFGTLVADTSAAVWIAGTRTLTGFGTLVADVAAAVWAYSVRTLTMTVTQLIAILSGSTITVQRGDTVTVPLTDLGNLTGRTKLYFTVKDVLSDADTEAILQIEETAGLMRLNGAAGTAADASLVVTDVPTGDITITLKPATTAALIARQNYRYDVQVVAGAVVTTLGTGTFTANEDVTRAIT